MWLSIDEACEKLKVSRSTLQRRLNTEEIKSKKEYGKRLVWCEGSNSNQSNDSEMKCTDKSNDKVRELFLTKSYNEIKQIIL